MSPSLQPSSVPDHFFRDLVETMNEAVWVGDEHERTIYANPRFCEIMEYTLEEMIGRESYDFWDQESAETVRKTNTSKRKQGIRSNYEGVLVSKTGKRVPVILSGSPVPGGGTVGIMTDLTELKKLQRKEKAISQAVSIASDCIFSYTREGSITSWNKGAKTIFGYKQSEITGNGISLLFPEESLDHFIHIVDNFDQIRFRALDKSGNTLTLSGAITPISPEYGDTPDEYLFIGRDITRQISIEEQIDKHCLKIKDAYMQLGLLQRQLDYIQDIIKFGKSEHWSHMSFYDFILRSLLFITDSELVQFWKYEKNNIMSLTGTMGKVQILPLGTKKPYKNSATEHAISLGKSVKIVEPEKHGEYEQFSPIKPHHNIYGVMLIPLGTQENPIGAIEIYVSEDKSLELFESTFIEDYISAVELVIKSGG